MNLSSILQSELYCTPTQLILVDVCLSDGRLKRFVDSLHLCDDGAYSSSYFVFSLSLLPFLEHYSSKTSRSHVKFEFQMFAQRLHHSPHLLSSDTPLCCLFCRFSGLYRHSIVSLWYKVGCRRVSESTVPSFPRSGVISSVGSLFSALQARHAGTLRYHRGWRGR